MVLLMYVGSGVAIYFTVDWVTDCPSVEKREDVDDGKSYSIVLRSLYWHSLYSDIVVCI